MDQPYYLKQAENAYVYKVTFLQTEKHVALFKKRCSFFFNVRNVKQLLLLKNANFGYVLFKF